MYIASENLEKEKRKYLNEKRDIKYDQKTCEEMRKEKMHNRFS